VKMSARWGVDVIYHASFTDDEALDLLEAKKDSIWVSPAINIVAGTLTNAIDYGYPLTEAEESALQVELKEAIKSMKELKKRGVRILPGGDYGFAWTPHGTYAKDLEHFVNLFDFTPMEAIIAATAGGGDIFMRPHELGKVLPGYYADVILVDGNPLDDIRILQDQKKLHYILINGRVHKSHPSNAAPVPPIAGQDKGSHPIVPNESALPHTPPGTPPNVKAGYLALLH